MKNNAELDVVFLCGGDGSRMGKLTKQTQKVMIPFKEKPILQYGLEAAIEAFRKVNLIIAIAYLGDQIKDYFGNNWRDQKLTYIPHPEGSEDRGALRTICNALLIDRPFIVVHGNIIYKPEALLSNYENQLAERPISTLSLATKSDESKHALVKLSENKISKIAIPDPENDSIDLDKYGIEIYSDISEQELIKDSWLRDMGVNSYSQEIFKLIDKYTEDYMAHMFWILVSEFQRGRDIGTAIYEDNWYHFQEPGDLNR